MTESNLEASSGNGLLICEDVDVPSESDALVQDRLVHQFRERLQKFNYSLDSSAFKASKRYTPDNGLPLKACTRPDSTDKSLDVSKAAGSPNRSSVLTTDACFTLSSKRKGKTAKKQHSLPKRPRLTNELSPITPAVNNLEDSLRPGLILVSIGVNPSIMSGMKGEPYCHPSNRYWPTLHLSGITPVRHLPSDTHNLMDLYGMGHTNIVAHIASREAKDLSKEDYDAGATDLDRKIREFKPQAVMLVGKGIWEEWFRFKKGRRFNSKKEGFHYGWQDKSLWIGREEGVYNGSPTFVVTSTSGAATQLNTEERVAIWKPMGEWFTPKRDAWIEKQERIDKNIVNNI